MAFCSSPLFFFNDTATTEIYTLSLHDALPISAVGVDHHHAVVVQSWRAPLEHRSEEHTSELQSRLHLVCRLLLEKKKKTYPPIHTSGTGDYRPVAGPAVRR